MKSQITERALAGKCPGRGAIGLGADRLGAAMPGLESRPCPSSRAASASMPKPEPVRLRNWRRSAKAGCGEAKRWGSRVMAGAVQESRKGRRADDPRASAGSSDVDELVEAHENLAEV